MKKLISLFVLSLLFAVGVAQTVTVTFTGRDTNNQYVKLDKVVIDNVTKNWQETITYPDTILTMGGVGIKDYDNAYGFALFQNNPNPFDGTTYASLRTSENGEVTVGLLDVNGRIVETLRATSLQPGIHQFRIQVANAGTYLLTARQNGKTSSVKMVNNGKGAMNKIEYQNYVEKVCTPSLPTKSTKGTSNNPFDKGDEMTYTGSATVNGTEYQSQTVRQNQQESEEITLQFAIATALALPTVTTDPVSNITAVSATCGGNVTDDGGAEITERGVCYSTKFEPTIADTKVTATGTTGTFTCDLTGLQAGTSYYVRAYATNSEGTAYGEEVKFTTVSLSLPTVTTAEVTSITERTAIGGGDVTDDGGASVTVRGLCYGTSSNPTVSGKKAIASGTMGAFTCNLIELSPGTKYYVRAYATNSVGTAYGEEVTFTTEEHIYGKACPGLETVTDHEGNVYKTVLLGNQCWMRENMRCTTSPSTGTTILEKSPKGISYSGKKAYYVSGLEANTATYGLLYNWYAAMDTFNTKFGETSTSDDYEACPMVSIPDNRRGICPEGWHVPSKEDWITLTTYVSSQKEFVSCDTNICIAPALASTESWLSSPNEGAIGYTPANNNATGFSAVAAGFYSFYGFEALGYLNNLWTATQEDSITVDMIELNKSYSFVNWGQDYKCSGFSVRCVQDPIGANDGKPCPGAATVTDFDNNTYNTVQIGEQCWMKENLRTTHFSDGKQIDLGTATSDTEAYRYYPNNDSKNVNLYGYLYNWSAAMYNSESSDKKPSGVQGICPTGWHVPSDAEWTQLTDYVSSQSKYACGNDSTSVAKALASTSDWNKSTTKCAVGNNQEANNMTGFSALPAGGYAGNYANFGSYAFFRSTTTSSNNTAYGRSLNADSAAVTRNRNFSDVICGFSVRCLKD